MNVERIEKVNDKMRFSKEDSNKIGQNCMVVVGLIKYSMCDCCIAASKQLT
jgi:hypothetical protein